MTEFRFYDDGEADDDDGDGKPDIDKFSDRDWVDIERLQAEMDRIGAIDDDDENLAESIKLQKILSGGDA